MRRSSLSWMYHHKQHKIKEKSKVQKILHHWMYWLLPVAMFICILISIFL